MPSEPISNRGDSKSEEEVTPKTKDDNVVAAAASVSLKRKGSEDTSKDEKEEAPKAATDTDTAVATKTSVPSKPKGAEDSSKIETEEAPNAATTDDAVTAKTALSLKEKGYEESTSDEKKAAPKTAPEPPADAAIAPKNSASSKRKESEDSSKAEREAVPEPPAAAAKATKTSVSPQGDGTKESSKGEKKSFSEDEKEVSSKNENEAVPEPTTDATGAAKTSVSPKLSGSEDSPKAKGELTPKASKRKGSEHSSDAEGEAEPDITPSVTVAATIRTSSSKKRKRKADKDVLPPPPPKLNHVLFAPPTSETKKKRSKKRHHSGVSSDPENDDGVEKVAKGSIASLVLQRIGKFKPCYLLSESSDDEQPKKTGDSAAYENAPSKSAPAPRPETRVDEGNKNAFSRSKPSLSDDDDSSEDSPHEPIFFRVTFRPTVVPQSCLLEQHNEQQAQEASPDHQTNGHGRASTSAAQSENGSPPHPDIGVARTRRDPGIARPLDAIDVDETSSATSSSNSTKGTDREVPTVDEIKKCFLASVERTFNASFQQSTREIHSLRHQRRQVDEKALLAKRSNSKLKTVWDERVKDKDKELKGILQSSSYAKTLAAGLFEEWSGDDDSDY